MRTTAHAPLGWADGRAGAYVQVGLKTSGFVEGDPLEGGPLVRVGLSLRGPSRP